MTMPPSVGAKVLDALPVPVPVVGDLRDSRWTFLVRPDCPVPMCLAAQLAEWGVTVAGQGRGIVLPGSDAGWGARWVSEPAASDDALPGQRDIIGAAYRCGQSIPQARIG
ncbi:hypothetical protein [Nocardia sp. BMG51109]|uniref:hypothetical protein n=1 Tax=Nocardia sp. BMG51109 TaxID=1056816 RepID=UPI0012EC6353|nr:hypothetical protein [Nocardia sp. BMG51109]